MKVLVLLLLVEMAATAQHVGNICQTTCCHSFNSGCLAQITIKNLFENGSFKICRNELKNCLKSCYENHGIEKIEAHCYY